MGIAKRDNVILFEDQWHINTDKGARPLPQISNRIYAIQLTVFNHHMAAADAILLEHVIAEAVALLVILQWSYDRASVISVAQRANHSLCIDVNLLVQDGEWALDDHYAHSCSFPHLLSGNSFTESKICHSSLTVLSEVEDKPSIVPSKLTLSSLKCIAASGLHHLVHLCHNAILTIFPTKHSRFWEDTILLCRKNRRMRINLNDCYMLTYFLRASVCLAATLKKIKSYLCTKFQEIVLLTIFILYWNFFCLFLSKVFKCPM